MGDLMSEGLVLGTRVVYKGTRASKYHTQVCPAMMLPTLLPCTDDEQQATRSACFLY